MAPRARRPTSRVASTPRAVSTPKKTIPLLPDFDQLKREKEARNTARLAKQLEELRRQDAAIGRRRATRRAAGKTATPRAPGLTPRRIPSTPPAEGETSAQLLAKLRQENLEEGARRAEAENQKRLEGRRRYREVMAAQKKAASGTPRSHSMRTPIKTGGKRKRGQRMTEGQITRVVNSFLDELTGGRKKKSRSNTRTHVRRQPVGRRRRQRRR